MEETVQPETQELEYKNPNEDQGGIRRRLRDRDLLKKRKAEAEENETNQWVLGTESKRKRARADEKSGAKKRGRPKKGEPTPLMPLIQEEARLAQGAPSVVAAVPQPEGIISDQTPGPLTPALAAGQLEPPPESSPFAAPAPPSLVFGSMQRPLFAPFATPPTRAPALLPPSVTAPVPVRDAAPDAFPVPAPSQAPVPAPASPQGQSLYTTQTGETVDEVFIEYLGRDEKEDIAPLQDKGDDETLNDLTETLIINIPEQNKMFSVPTLSSPPPPQEYLPGN